MRLIGRSLANGWWRTGLTLAVVLVGSAPRLLAHDPMSSWAIVQLRPETIEVEIVFAPSEAFLFIRDAAPQIRGITYENFPFVKPMLVAQAPSLLTFSVDEQPVAPQKTTVTLTPEDDLEFVLTFPRPKPGVVGFDAQFLNRVSPEHMTYLSVIAEDGTFLAGSEPIVGETMTFVDLPPPQVPAVEKAG